MPSPPHCVANLRCSSSCPTTLGSRTAPRTLSERLVGLLTQPRSGGVPRFVPSSSIPLTSLNAHLRRRPHHRERRHIVASLFVDGIPRSHVSGRAGFYSCSSPRVGRASPVAGILALDPDC